MTGLGARDLAVARGGLRVIEGLDLALGPGQGAILRGANGIGKTSLLRTLAGLQPPAAGEVIRPDEGLAFAGHADALKPALSVTENLAFWARLMEGPRDIAPALDRMDLAHLADRPAGRLSAGQRRRLGLARLIVSGRAVWALDEPTVSLDTASVARFEDVLRAHMAQGGIVIAATHVPLDIPAATIDLGPFRARPGAQAARPSSFHEAFG